MHGAIICKKCHKAKPNCGCDGKKCYIKFRYQGKAYYRRRNEQGLSFEYKEAFYVLTALNEAMLKPNFDPERHTDLAIEERCFNNQFAKYIEDKRRELQAGELSPEYVRIISGYNKHYAFFEDMDITKVDKKKLADFKRTLGDMKIKSRRNVLNSLRAFFHWLFAEGVITIVPPFPEVKGNDAARRIAITWESQQEMLARIPAEDRDPIAFMMETGIRPGECIALLCKSVDLENRVAWIERTRSGATYRETTKENTKLPVPLNDRAYAIAKRNMKFPADFLFVNRRTGRCYSYKALYHVWASHCPEVSLYEATRHSFCSQIVPLTDSLTAQRLMRHADKRSTDNYYHAFAGTLLEVVQKRGKVVGMTDTKTIPKTGTFER